MASVHIIDNYKEYRKKLPEYKLWEENRNLDEAKRNEYIKQNNIDIKDTVEIKRAKAILNAVDIMDEYSQSRAEDTEMIVQTASQGITQLGNYIGMGSAALSLLIKPIRSVLNEVIQNKNFKKSPLLLIPALLYLIPSITPSVYLSIFSASKETKASRLGRIEAMNDKLSNPNQFAILNENQEKEVEKLSKDIKITPKDVKKQVNASRGIGVIKSIKTIFLESKEEEKRIEEANEKFKQDIKIDNNTQLNQEEIEQAKKDKQLIQKIVEDINIASQDYAEDVELATGTVTAVALGSGGVIGIGLKAILSKVKNMSGKTANTISIGVGLALSLLGAIYSTKVQKEASRVARYKIKKDFMEHPEKIIYIDDEKLKDIKVEKEEKPKKNYFKFIVNIFKDNKEYKEYLKTEKIEQLKRQEALEKIELTPEQEKDAKTLQKNVFKMFNKVDEKSQVYSESTEALGEIIQTIGSIIGMIPGAIGVGFNSMKKSKVGAITSYISMFIPAIILNIIVTKQQKEASKVANMQAIKELDDYRNFVSAEDKINATNKNNVATKEKGSQFYTPVWKN